MAFLRVFGRKAYPPLFVTRGFCTERSGRGGNSPATFDGGEQRTKSPFHKQRRRVIPESLSTNSSKRMGFSSRPRLNDGEEEDLDEDAYDFKKVELGDGEDVEVTGSFARRPFSSDGGGRARRGGTRTAAAADEDEPIDFRFDPYAKEPRKCILCQHKIQLDYKNTRLLQQFVSSFSGRVYDRHVTGLCDEQHDILLKTVAMSRKAGYMPILTKDPKFVKDPKLFDPLRPVRQHSFA